MNSSTTMSALYENRSRNVVETYEDTSVSKSPSRTPPITAPGRLPNPPITAAMKALFDTEPIAGYTVYFIP